MNVALSYIRGWDEGNAEKPTVRILKFDDDINPSQGRVAWKNEPKQFRNFFFDQRELERQGFEMAGGYRGYDFDTPRRTVGHQISIEEHGPIVQMLEAPIDQLKYSKTSFGEDLTPFRYRMLPFPGYCVHSGKRSTYRHNRTGAFGNYKNIWIGEVQAANSADVRHVAHQSGIRSPP